MNYLDYLETLLMLSRGYSLVEYFTVQLVNEPEYWIANSRVDRTAFLTLVKRMEISRIGEGNQWGLTDKGRRRLQQIMSGATA